MACIRTHWKINISEHYHLSAFCRNRFLRSAETIFSGLIIGSDEVSTIFLLIIHFKIAQAQRNLLSKFSSFLFRAQPLRLRFFLR